MDKILENKNPTTDNNNNNDKKVQEPTPVVIPKPTPVVVPKPSPVVNPVFQEPNPNPVALNEPAVVSVQPVNEEKEAPDYKQEEGDNLIRIEKIESEMETTGYFDEDEPFEYHPPEKYVIFRIYSPYYEIYKSLFTTEYFQSIGLSVFAEEEQKGGGEQTDTFPYNLFKALFDNTFGRFGTFFEPKKESLAEETLKKTDTLLSSVSNFKTEELLKPIDTPTENTIAQNTTGLSIPPYFEIKLPKSGKTLSQKEYNEQKLRNTNDDILEHDEYGKTYQEILLETKQDEIQRARKRTLLSILETSLKPNPGEEKITEKIKKAEKNSQTERVWFIQQSDVEEEEKQGVDVHKWIKLDLSLV